MCVCVYFAPRAQLRVCQDRWRDSSRRSLMMRWSFGNLYWRPSSDMANIYIYICSLFADGPTVSKNDTEAL